MDIIYNLLFRKKNISPLQPLMRAGPRRAKYQLEEPGCGVAIWHRQTNPAATRGWNLFSPTPLSGKQPRSRSSTSSGMPSTYPGLGSCRWPGRNTLASPGGIGELTVRSINILIPLSPISALSPDSLSGAESRSNGVVEGEKQVMVPARVGATEQGNSLCISLSLPSTCLDAYLP